MLAIVKAEAAADNEIAVQAGREILRQRQR
jgi:hypothetical protein